MSDSEDKDTASGYDADVEDNNELEPNDSGWPRLAKYNSMPPLIIIHIQGHNT